MNKSFLEKLSGYYKTEKKFELLECAYIALFVATLLIAGLISLINHSVGIVIVKIALFLLIACVSNYVIWALIRTTNDYMHPEEPKKEKKNLKK
ncbi:hypothetical protein J6W91_03370 [Candidatus Saccharibacteria bacterium]|nr:hypothetical protein [Candidatus Saccharibacteria bacterium]